MPAGDVWKKQDVDELAVTLYVEGGWGDSLPPLNSAEKREATRRMNEMGLDDLQIALRLRVRRDVARRMRVEMGCAAIPMQSEEWQAA